MRKSYMPIKLISEIGSNHNQDLNRAIQLIEYSAWLGFDAVKFQLFKANKLYAPQHKEMIETIKKRELPIEWLPTLKKVSQDNGLEFGCTPFYLDAVDELNPYVDFFKIGSFENQWNKLIEKVISTDKEIMISLGMMSIDSIKYQWALPKFDVIFHCVSSYPVKPKDCNLKTLNVISKIVGSPLCVGWSDHSVNEGVIYRAIAEGARVIEMHVDLPDRQGLETIIDHVWTDKIVLTQLIRNIRDGEKAISEREDVFENMEWKCNPETGLRG